MVSVGNDKSNSRKGNTEKLEQDRQEIQEQDVMKEMTVFVEVSKRGRLTSEQDKCGA